jgi:hypothetical protein
LGAAETIHIKLPAGWQKGTWLQAYLIYIDITMGLDMDMDRAVDTEMDMDTDKDVGTENNMDTDKLK